MSPNQLLTPGVKPVRFGGQAATIGDMGEWSDKVPVELGHVSAA
ncbi:hypothetical protein [Actinoplanes philippinensis]|nr:hypothetical protein [Actinoplanes philippinensis]